jgi:hypothetical protein
MKKLSAAAVIGMLACAISGTSTAATFEECKDVSNTQNKTYPMALDEMTTLITSYCVKEGNRLVLANKYLLSASSASEMKSDGASLIKKATLSGVCADTDVKASLQEVDLRYEYVFKNLKPYTAFTIKNGDCKK